MSYNLSKSSMVPTWIQRREKPRKAPEVGVTVHLEKGGPAEGRRGM